jgi:hypothetical protein
MVVRCRCGLQYRASRSQSSHNARAGYYHQLALHSGRQPVDTTPARDETVCIMQFPPGREFEAVEPAARAPSMTRT